MAINAYTGLMGHGKTYQAVKDVIVKSYSQGRNIVTNIEGINEPLIKEYCLKNYSSLKEEDLGTITIIKDDVINKDGFFPTEEVDDEGNVLKTIDGIVKQGDIVVIDEAWKYFQQGTKLSKEQDTFFRKMRHYVNSKGHTCDLVLITQDHTLLNRGLKNLIEMLFVTKKLKTLGKAGESSYTVTIFEGNRTTKSSQISHSVHKYEKDIFPLYKSYSKENAKEQSIDDRTNYFKSPYFKWTLILTPIFLLVGFYFLYDVYSGFQKDAEAHKAKMAEKNKTNIEEEKIGTTAQNTSTSSSSAVNSNTTSSISATYKIAGHVFSENRHLLFIKDENEKVRIINNPQCYGRGYLMACHIDNEVITY